MSLGGILAVLSNTMGDGAGLIGKLNWNISQVNPRLLSESKSASPCGLADKSDSPGAIVGRAVPQDAFVELEFPVPRRCRYGGCGTRSCEHPTSDTASLPAGS